MTDGKALADAAHALETAALIARVPRPAVTAYVRLATAALAVHTEIVENMINPSVRDYVALDDELAEVVLDATELLSDATWATPATRWVWLRRRLHRLEHKTRPTRWTAGNRTRSSTHPRTAASRHRPLAGGMWDASNLFSTLGHMYTSWAIEIRSWRR